MDFGLSVRSSLHRDSRPIQNPKSKIRIRGRLTGRTLGFEPGNKGSTPFPGEIHISNLKSHIRAFHRWLYGLVLGASVRRFESCCPDQNLCTRGPIGRGACLRNKLIKDRILSRVPARFGIGISDFFQSQFRNPNSQIKSRV